MVNHRRGHQDHASQSARDRALCSHVAAQSKGISQFLGDDDSVKWAFSTNVFDDASMWVRKPKGYDLLKAAPRSASSSPRGRTGTSLLPLLASSLDKKGKNVHMPVLNLCETLFVGREANSENGATPKPIITRAVRLHVPAQVLPTANIATIRDRWSQWTVLSAAGVGRKHGLELQQEFQRIPWKTMLLVRDNLGVNSGIVGLEEEILLSELAMGAVDGPSLLSISCCAHSAVLAMKPLYASLDGLPGQLVKLAHVLESGRTARSFVEELQKEVSEHFVYKEVRELPAQAQQWRDHAAGLLRQSRPVQDLTPTQENTILAADNGDWDDDLITHWCVRGKCPLECQGCPKKSLAIVTSAIVLSLGGPVVVPLLYRWKGFEKAAAWVFRGRRQHNLLHRAFRRLFPPATVKYAQEEAARAAAASEEVSFGLKLRVRASSVLQSFERDPQGLLVQAATVLNGPLQTFLNCAFKAELATLKAVEVLSTRSSAPASVEAGAEHLQEARAQNWAIISGARGMQVLRDFSALLRSYEAGAWSELSLPKAEKFRISSSIVCCMADAWRRLVWAFEQPKFQVFKAAACEEYSPTLIRQAVEPLANQAEACQGCADLAFGKPWVGRLLDPRGSVARRAHSCLLDMLACMPVSSASCERKHLLGQETKGGPKRRGRALACSTLSQVTYTKSVRKEFERTRQLVMDQVLGSSSSVRRSFEQNLSRLTLGRPMSRKRKAEADGEAHLASLKHQYQLGSKVRRTRAYDVFVAEKYDEQPAALSMSEKRSRAARAWKQLSPEQLAYYEGRAAGVNAAKEQLVGLGFAKLLENEAARSLPKATLLSMKKRAVLESLQQMQEHDLWGAGLGLQCLDSGLKEELVQQGPDSAMQSECSDIFGYDGAPKANRKVNAKHSTVCCQKHGGLCASDPMACRCDLATKNLYHHMKKRFAQLSYPYLVQLSVQGLADSEHWLLARIVGKGDLALLVGLDIAPSCASENLQVATLSDAGEGACKVGTSNMVFRRLAATSSAALGVAATDIKGIEVSCFDMAFLEGSDRFAITIGSRKCSFEASMVKAERGHRAQKLESGELKLPFGLSTAMPLEGEQQDTNDDESDDPEGHLSNTRPKPKGSLGLQTNIPLLGRFVLLLSVPSPRVLS